MEGNSENPGMIPRAVMQIFDTAQGLKSKGWTYTFEAYFLEIYNETIRDLLSSSASGDKKHDIKHNASTGKTAVTDITIGMYSTPRTILWFRTKQHQT
jgi:kinesin family protein C1